MDIRLSNTASRADYWMATYPGTEAAVLLAMARIILKEKLYNEEFMANWVNWQQWLQEDHPETEITLENAIRKLIEHYDELSSVLNNLSRISTILIDMCRDIWLYISMGYFKLKTKPDEAQDTQLKFFSVSRTHNRHLLPVTTIELFMEEIIAS